MELHDSSVEEHLCDGDDVQGLSETTFGNSHLYDMRDRNSLVGTTVTDCDRSLGLAILRSQLLNLLHNLHGILISDLAKHDVGSVQPAGDHSRDKELRAVGVLAGVGH